MVFVELGNPEELTNFLNEHNDVCIITFSATWCGPCKATKPRLMEIAKTSPIPIGYVYEEDLEDFLDVFVKLSAFPTYILFKEGEETMHVQGANLDEVEKMIAANAPTTK